MTSCPRCPENLVISRAASGLKLTVGSGSGQQFWALFLKVTCEATGFENQLRVSGKSGCVTTQAEWTQRTWDPDTISLPSFILSLMLLAPQIAITFLKLLVGRCSFLLVGKSPFLPGIAQEGEGGFLS